MIVLPSAQCEDDAAAKSLVGIELARIKEYGSIAENSDEIASFVQELEGAYGTQEMSFDEDVI